MTNVSLEAVLDASGGKADSKKIARLSSLLQAALDSPLSEIPADEPMLIRRSMVRQLRLEDVSPGNLQAMEQFFMGVVRRASVDGLIPAPPEGPWTHAWQTAIDTASGQRAAKARMRSLAAWATERELPPLQVNDELLTEWCEASGRPTSDKEVLLSVLGEWAKECHDTLHQAAASNLNERLQRKAKRGTVFHERP